MTNFLYFNEERRSLLSRPETLVEILSLVANSALAWQVLAGTLRPT